MRNMLTKSYNKAGIPLDKERLEARNNGLIAFLDNYGTVEIEGIIELFFLGKGTTEIVSNFVHFFQEHDPLFDEDNLDEVRLLAGNALYNVVLERDEDKDFEIRLWSIMYHFLGNDGFSATITNEIIKTFNSDSAEIREEFVSIDGLLITHIEDCFFDKENNEFVGDSSYSLKTASSLQNMMEKMNELIDGHNKTIGDILEVCKRLYEDNQILWWIMGGYSDQRERKYQDLEIKEAAYLIGRDLANLVSVNPGPISARQMIGHMLGEDKKYKKISIAEFVDGIGDDLMDDEYDKTPLLFALSKKRESGIGHWNKQVKDRFGMNVECQMEIETLAYEIYIEWIFAKYCSED